MKRRTAHVTRIVIPTAATSGTQTIANQMPALVARWPIRTSFAVACSTSSAGFQPGLGVAAGLAAGVGELLLDVEDILDPDGLRHDRLEGGLRRPEVCDPRAEVDHRAGDL